LPILVHTWEQSVLTLQDLNFQIFVFNFLVSFFTCFWVGLLLLLKKLMLPNLQTSKVPVTFFGNLAQIQPPVFIFIFCFISYRPNIAHILACYAEKAPYRDWIQLPVLPRYRTVSPQHRGRILLLVLFTVYTVPVPWLKGTLTRDFRPLFFIKQFTLGP
jgi:hypothetical protein